MDLVVFIEKIVSKLSLFSKEENIALDLAKLIF